MNLPTLSDIDPETGHTWDRGATGIGFEPEHIPVEFLHGFELWRFRIDADGVVVDFENADAHRRSSSSRPTNGPSADPCKASKRLATALGRRTCQAGTGAAMPLTSTAPRSRYSKRLPSSRRVLAAITTVSGSAKFCSRAARFGV